MTTVSRSVIHKGGNVIRSSRFWCSFPLLIAATPALADPGAAEACAKTLSPAALQIYQAAAPDMRPDSDMANVLRDKVLPLVMAGDMNRRTARVAATEASVCLRGLQQQNVVVAASGLQRVDLKGPAPAVQ